MRGASKSRGTLPNACPKLFFSIFMRPGQRLAKFFKGMDMDLYRANMRTTPERYAAKMIGVSLIVTVFAISLMFFFKRFLDISHPRRDIGICIFHVLHQDTA